MLLTNSTVKIKLGDTLYTLQLTDSDSPCKIYINGENYNIATKDIFKESLPINKIYKDTVKIFMMVNEELIQLAVQENASIIDEDSHTILFDNNSVQTCMYVTEDTRTVENATTLTTKEIRFESSNTTIDLRESESVIFDNVIIDTNNIILDYFRVLDAVISTSLLENDVTLTDIMKDVKGLTLTQKI